jgi:hypothetical protein
MGDSLRDRIDEALAKAKAEHKVIKSSAYVISINDNTGLTHAKGVLELDDQVYHSDAFGRPDETEDKARAKCLEQAGYLTEEGR